MGNLTIAEDLLSKELRRAKAAGASEVGKIEGSIAPNERGFALGDKIYIPTNKEGDLVHIFKQPIAGSSANAFYILVKVEDKSGKARCTQLYPSTFGKYRYPFDKSTGMEKDEPVETEGNIADLYHNMPSAQEFLDSIYGAVIEVTKVTPVTCLRFRSQTETTTTNVYSFNLVSFADDDAQKTKLKAFQESIK